MISLILTHDDGTTVQIGRDGVVWTEPNGRVSREDAPLWPPKVYALRLVRRGFHRRERR